MKQPGPALSRLQHRLSDTPATFWQPDAKTPCWPLPALVHDLLWHHRLDVTAADLEAFRGKSAHHPWYASTRLVIWLLMDETFAPYLTNKRLALSALTTTAEALHAGGRPAHYVDDIDRREEFIRVVLDTLELRPEGETPDQAQDRLASISSAERMKLIAASRAAEERARQVREALARKAAEEAADKWTRE